MFIDKVQLRLHAGKGGNGIIAWRRMKYMPKGGPAGGDGGDGASIFIEACEDLYSLDTFVTKKVIQAPHGDDGGQKGKQGKRGKNLILKVPTGTQIRNAHTKELLIDLINHKERIEICHGGKGGFGNVHFKSPTNRTPYKCTSGRLGTSAEVELELKLLADVGFVGLPNAGKSTLFSTLTPYLVKVADYPFTTLKPNLSYIEFDDYQRLFLADIPGIIEDAHKGKGLGIEFLKHIERCSLLIFVLDAAPISENRNPINDFLLLQNELQSYNSTLLERPKLILLNKIDAPNATTHIAAFKEKFSSLTDSIFTLSAKTGQGVTDFIETLQSAKQSFKCAAITTSTLGKREPFLSP